jgi:hypothetical protein
VEKWDAWAVVDFQKPLTDDQRARVRHAFEAVTTLGDLDETSLRFKMRVSGPDREGALNYAQRVTQDKLRGLGFEREDWDDRLTNAERVYD